MNTPKPPALPNNEGDNQPRSAEEMLKSFHSPLYLYLVEVIIRALAEWQEMMGAPPEGNA